MTWKATGSSSSFSGGIFKSRIPLLLVLLLLGTFISCNKLVIHEPEYATDPADWPQLGGNPQHSGYVAVRLSPPFLEIWQHKPTSKPGRVIIAKGNTLFFGTQDGTLESVNIQTGKRAGFITVRGTEERSALIYKNSLFIIRRLRQPSYELYDLLKGKSYWRQKGKMVLNEPLLVNDQVFVTDIEGTLHCLALSDGETIWSTNMKAPGHVTPAYADNVIITGNDEGILIALDMTGQIIWKFETGSALRAAPVISKGAVYIGPTDSVFYAIDHKSGTRIWQTKTDGKIYYPAAVNNSVVVFGATDQKLYCLEKYTGAIKWTFNANGVISTAPLITDNVVFCGSQDSHIYCLDLQTGKELWSFKARGRISTHPILVGRKLVFGCDRDRVYCFE